MKPAFHRTSRRHFLLGAGGVSLAIPLLPSLLPKESRAQTVAAAGQQRYFVHMTTMHGAFHEQVYGDLLRQTPTMTAKIGPVDVRGAPLPGAATSGRTRWSDTINASASLLSPRIAGLMNVINGLDMQGYPGHNDGGTLGNFGVGVDSKYPAATIDQVMAYSSAFYPTAVTMPAITRNKISFGWANRAARSGGLVSTTQAADTNQKLFDALFPGGGTVTTTTTSSAPRPIAVDKVREHAKAVLANPRCSADCRARLTQYMDMIADVQSKLTTVATVTTSSSRPSKNTGSIESSDGFYGAPDSHVEVERLWNDVVVAAFAAGASRIYVSAPNNYVFGPEPPQVWHDSTAHKMLGDSARYALYSAALQRQFEGVFLDFAQKLDAVRGPDGGTLLDRSLVVNSHELGSGGEPGQHHNRCIPVITIGSAGGYFRTGLSLDYRDFPRFPAPDANSGDKVQRYGGLVYNQWLGMILRSMGVAPSEYAAGAAGHFGYPSVMRDDNEHTPAVWAVAGQDLPFLKA